MNKKITHIVRSSILIALIAIMTFVPNVGYIVIVPASLSFTTLHIIVIIASWAFGMTEAIVSGAAFGLCCFIKAVAMPTSITDPAFVNPLISILPRVAFGALAGWLYHINSHEQNIKKRWAKNVAVIPFVCLFHSVFVLSMYYIFALRGTETTYADIMLGILSLNSLVEVGGAILICPSIVAAIFKAKPELKERRKKENL